MSLSTPRLTLMLLFVAIAAGVIPSLTENHLEENPDEWNNLQWNHPGVIDLLDGTPTSGNTWGANQGSDPHCPLPCGPCVPTKCALPRCKCSNGTIPGKIPRLETPQIVMVTTQSALTNESYAGFVKVFEGLKNPNNCSATGTYYVSHPYTDYFLVQSLRSQGHEIGDNTVTGTGDAVEYWKNATFEEWRQQMKDQIAILKRYANVTDVRGFRAPYLQPGGDRQMQALKGLLRYDSSMVSVKFSRRSDKLNISLLWPYTFDYQSTQDCVTPECPSQCYPGLWEIPLLTFWDQTNKSCGVLDACNIKTYNDVFRILYDTLSAHYRDNRAPVLITLTPEFLRSDFKVKGLKLFLQYMASYKDVYIVSAGRALDWIRHPTPLSKLDRFRPWMCNRPNPPVCKESQAITCRYGRDRRPSSTGPYLFRTCYASGRPKGCPACYPWLGDTSGRCR